MTTLVKLMLALSILCWVLPSPITWAAWGVAFIAAVIELAISVLRPLR